MHHTHVLLQEQAVRMIQNMSDEKMQAFKELVATRYIRQKNICRMTLIGCRVGSRKKGEYGDIVY